MTDNKSPVSWKLRRKNEGKEQKQNSSGYKNWRDKCDSSFRSRSQF